MTTEWRITQKPDFYKALLALSPKEIHQVLEKINLLAQDPTPDAKVKKQLKHMNGRLHRLRSGNFRIFYTFEQPYISILALRRRDDDTYDEDMDVEFLGGLDPDFDEAQAVKAAQPDWERILAPKEPEKRQLPEPITEGLLAELYVPKECYARLLRIQTQEDLYECPGVPDDYKLKIDEYMFERPLVEVLQQPDYLLTDVNDLLRYKEGELLGFLLKLSPEQEKYVTWGINASGPTLLKGGPGTGKSTIALYRVRSLVQELLKKGRNDFRILFTTYTNALVKSSEQLLQQLLGDDVRYVEVQTADKIVMKLLGRVGAITKFVDDYHLTHLVQQRGEETWQQARAKAESLIAGGMVGLNYDAVIIDEAQDLDPSALRLLVRMCNQSNRVFITADANQSIYGSGFNWSDVHERLKFQGRTSILRVNYRSTREIGEAAQSYLSAGMLDDEQVERSYVNSGPVPGVRVIRSGGEEVQLLSRFLPAAAHEFRLSIGACAVLCPTAKAGKAIAAELTHRGIEATFMPGQELNLSRPGVKVLTLKSAKGLEFPIVALAGFRDSGWYTHVPTSVPAEEREEFLAMDRRTMFVGMTRAMRALLVTVPLQARSPLLEGFEGVHWNLGG